jgi:hypothetical protein
MRMSPMWVTHVTRDPHGLWSELPGCVRGLDALGMPQHDGAMDWGGNIVVLWVTSLWSRHQESVPWRRIGSPRKYARGGCQRSSTRCRRSRLVDGALGSRGPPRAVSSLARLIRKSRKGAELMLTSNHDKRFGDSRGSMEVACRCLELG